MIKYFSSIEDAMEDGQTTFYLNRAIEGPNYTPERIDLDLTYLLGV